jgi:hypothetical protein
MYVAGKKRLRQQVGRSVQMLDRSTWEKREVGKSDRWAKVTGEQKDRDASLLTGSPPAVRVYLHSVTA